MNIWASMFCMGNPNKVKPKDVVPLYFDDENDSAPITEEDVIELQDEMAFMNSRNQSETQE